MVIGKGGETIRALSEEFEAQIDVDDDGIVRVFAVDGDQGDALIDRIRSMTKEVEVGDEFTGKVVKTTTFGAFVELSKGTDGLLHISNVKPGERVDTVEDVLNRGDEIDVRVVEVDKERGRIGLRLADDPDIAGKSGEELAVGRHRRQGPRGGGGDRGGRGGRDRGGRDGVTAAAAPASCTLTRQALKPERHRRSTRASGSSPSTFRRCARSRWASGSGPAAATRAPSRRGSRTSSSTCCSRAPTASARWRSTRSSTPWAPR